MQPRRPLSPPRLRSRGVSSVEIILTIVLVVLLAFGGFQLFGSQIRRAYWVAGQRLLNLDPPELTDTDEKTIGNARRDLTINAAGPATGKARELGALAKQAATQLRGAPPAPIPAQAPVLASAPPTPPSPPETPRLTGEARSVELALQLDRAYLEDEQAAVLGKTTEAERIELQRWLSQTEAPPTALTRKQPYYERNPREWPATRARILVALGRMALDDAIEKGAELDSAQQGLLLRKVVKLFLDDKAALDALFKKLHPATRWQLLAALGQERVPAVMRGVFNDSDLQRLWGFVSQDLRRRLNTLVLEAKLEVKKPDSAVAAEKPLSDAELKLLVDYIVGLPSTDATGKDFPFEGHKVLSSMTTEQLGQMVMALGRVQSKRMNDKPFYDRASAGFNWAMRYRDRFSGRPPADKAVSDKILGDAERAGLKVVREDPAVRAKALMARIETWAAELEKLERDGQDVDKRRIVIVAQIEADAAAIKRDLELIRVLARIGAQPFDEKSVPAALAKVSALAAPLSARTPTSIFREWSEGANRTQAEINALADAARARYGAETIRKIAAAVELLNLADPATRAAILGSPAPIDPRQLAAQLGNGVLESSPNKVLLEDIPAKVTAIRDANTKKLEDLQKELVQLDERKRAQIGLAAKDAKDGIPFWARVGSANSVVDGYAKAQGAQMQVLAGIDKLISKKFSEMMPFIARGQMLDRALALYEINAATVAGDQKSADAKLTALWGKVGEILRDVSPRWWNALVQQGGKPEETGAWQRRYQAKEFNFDRPPSLEMDDAYQRLFAAANLLVKNWKISFDGEDKDLVRAYAMRAIDEYPPFVDVQRKALELQKLMPEMAELLQAGLDGTVYSEYIGRLRAKATEAKAILDDPKLKENIATAKRDLADLMHDIMVRQKYGDWKGVPELKKREASLRQLIWLLENPSVRNTVETIFDKSKLDESTFKTWLKREGPKMVLSLVGAAAVTALVIASGGTAAPVVALALAGGGLLGRELGAEASYAFYNLFDADVLAGKATFTDRALLLKSGSYYDPKTNSYVPITWADKVGGYTKDLAISFTLNLAMMGAGKLAGAFVGKILALKGGPELLIKNEATLKAIGGDLARLESLAGKTAANESFKRVFMRELVKGMWGGVEFTVEQELLEATLKGAEIDVRIKDLHGSLGMLSSMLVAAAHGGRGVRLEMKGRDFFGYKGDVKDFKAGLIAEGHTVVEKDGVLTVKSAFDGKSYHFAPSEMPVEVAKAIAEGKVVVADAKPATPVTPPDGNLRNAPAKAPTPADAPAKPDAAARPYTAEETDALAKGVEAALKDKSAESVAALLKDPRVEVAQIGGGLAVISIPSLGKTLLIDARGRWPQDNSRTIFQSAFELMRGFLRVGLGDPRSFVQAIRDLVPIKAVTYLCDRIALGADKYVQGVGDARPGPGKSWIVTVRPASGGKPIDVVVEQRIVVASGLGPDVLPIKPEVWDPLHKAKVAFRGDEVVSDAFTAAEAQKLDHIIIFGIGGTAISAAKSYLMLNPKGTVEFVGRDVNQRAFNETDGAKDFTKQFAGRFTTSGGVDLFKVEVTRKDGKVVVRNPKDGREFKGDAVVSALFRDSDVLPAPLRGSLDALYKAGKLEGALLFDLASGGFVGYRIITPDGHEVDVTGAAARVLPTRIRWRKGSKFVDSPGDAEILRKDGRLVEKSLGKGNFDVGAGGSAQTSWLYGVVMSALGRGQPLLVSTKTVTGGTEVSGRVIEWLLGGKNVVIAPGRGIMFFGVGEPSLRIASLSQMEAARPGMYTLTFHSEGGKAYFYSRWGKREINLKAVLEVAGRDPGFANAKGIYVGACDSMALLKMVSAESGKWAFGPVGREQVVRGPDGKVTLTVFDSNGKPLPVDQAYAIVDPTGKVRYVKEPAKFFTDRVVYDANAKPIPEAREGKTATDGKADAPPPGPTPQAWDGRVLPPPPSAVEVHNHFLGVLGVDYFVRTVAKGDPRVLIDKLYDAVNADKGTQVEAPTAWKRLQEAKAARDRGELDDKAATAALRDILTATVTTPFDQAYSTRDALIKATIGYERFSKDTMRALIEQGVTYEETSNSLNKLNKDKFPPDMLTRVLAELRADPDLRARLDKAGRTGAIEFDLRQLALILTHNFSDRRLPDGKYKTASQLVELRAQIRKFLTGRGDAMGIDVGAPEVGRFTKKGMERLGGVMDEIADAAKVRGRPLVLRVHVGEGYGYDPKLGETFDRRHAARSGESFRHYKVARANVEAVLTMLEARGFKQGEGGVIVRLGHVTHATPEQLVRMAKMGIIVEGNLGSNGFGTGSLQRDPHKIPLADGKETGPPGEKNIYRNHPILEALFYDVHMVLGTDGQSVMNTTLQGEYAIAKAAIKAFVEGNATVRGTDGREVRFADITDPAVRARFVDAEGRPSLAALVRYAEAYRALVRQGDARDTQRARGGTRSAPEAKFESRDFPPSKMATTTSDKWGAWAAETANRAMEMVRAGKTPDEVLKFVADARGKLQEDIKGRYADDTPLFGRSRDGEAVTALVTKNKSDPGYGNEFRDALAAKLDKGGKAEGSLQTKWKTLDGTEVDATRIGWYKDGEVILFHPKPATMKIIFADVQARLAKAKTLAAAGDVDGARAQFAQAAVGLFQAMPYERGSEAIGRLWLAAEYLRVFGQKMPPLPDGFDVRSMLEKQPDAAKALEELFGAPKKVGLAAPPVVAPTIDLRDARARAVATRVVAAELGRDVGDVALVESDGGWQARDRGGVSAGAAVIRRRGSGAQRDRDARSVARGAAAGRGGAGGTHAAARGRRRSRVAARDPRRAGADAGRSGARRGERSRRPRAADGAARRLGTGDGAGAGAARRARRLVGRRALGAGEGRRRSARARGRRTGAAERRGGDARPCAASRRRRRRQRRPGARRPGERAHARRDRDAQAARRRCGCAGGRRRRRGRSRRRARVGAPGWAARGRRRGSARPRGHQRVRARLGRRRGAARARDPARARARAARRSGAPADDRAGAAATPRPRRRHALARRRRHEPLEPPASTTAS